MKEIVQKYPKHASALADWLEVGIPEGLTIFDFPVAQRRRILTSNLMEMFSQEVKLRTNMLRLFPNQAACLRLVSAILMDISDVLETGRIYLDVS